MWVFILSLVIVTLLIVLVRRRTSMFGQDSQIPKQIWTYWNDDTLTPVVQKCINSYRDWETV